MRQEKVKWIKKVVFSRHPVIMEMIKERLGKTIAEQLTYKGVIKHCKRMWRERYPGIEKWEIYKKAKEN